MNINQSFKSEKFELLLNFYCLILAYLLKTYQTRYFDCYLLILGKMETITKARDTMV